MADSSSCIRLESLMHDAVTFVGLLAITLFGAVCVRVRGLSYEGG